MLALSTSWKTTQSRFTKRSISQIKKLGFTALELAYSHTQSEIEQIVVRNAFTITSIHSFCPYPESVTRRQALPDCFNLASLKNAERRKAISLTKRSIRTAHTVRAKVVVIHCGRVAIPDYTKELIQLLIHKRDIVSFHRLRRYALLERFAKQKQHFQRVLQSIEEIADYASDHQVLIGIENRNYIREIPNFSEIPIILNRFARKNVRYWHDTGHAYILEQLGFQRNIDYVKTFNQYLVGIHLHDVKADLRDHFAPLIPGGQVDFKSLKPYLKRDTIKVVEAHTQSSAADVLRAKRKLEKLFP